MPTTTALTPEQEQAVLAILPTIAPRDRLLITAALRTGYRVSELLSLTIGNVWTDGGPRPAITVTRRHMKGGRGARRRAARTRTVPVTPSVAAALRDYVPGRLAAGAAPTDPLFLSRSRGRALSRWQANTILHRLLERAGIRGGSCYGMHSCRKAMARAIYEASGHDLRLVQRALGHRYCSTTEAYIAVDDDNVSAAIAALG